MSNDEITYYNQVSGLYINSLSANQKSSQKLLETLLCCLLFPTSTNILSLHRVDSGGASDTTVFFAISELLSAVTVIILV